MHVILVWLLDKLHDNKKCFFCVCEICFTVKSEEKSTYTREMCAVDCTQTIQSSVFMKNNAVPILPAITIVCTL